MDPPTNVVEQLKDERGFVLKADGTYDLSAPPPFTLSDIRAAIPDHCWQRNTVRSFAHLALDVGIVFGIAAAAYAANSWFVWPLYWLAQGTMFWALFVVGHDCGHQSFSPSRTINDLVGNFVHASILVPYHGWRVSHRKHHGNHGHVENDESWYPTTKSIYDKMDPVGRTGRLRFPWPLFAYPFYLFNRSPGKQGSHFDPECDLFVPSEKKMVLTSDAFLIGMAAILVAATAKLGIAAMFNLYFVPYWVFVMWLDTVTYLQHHGSSDPTDKLPWYRGEAWSYLRGGLTCLDRDYGIFHKITHNIGTHVVHHLFPQIPHYHLVDATEAVKPVLGPYYREPVPCAPHGVPLHLIEPLKRSFGEDHFVADEGEVVFYQQDPKGV
ncbi:omega-3 fatty acid desaturase (delta-15desaturase) [Monoraphidium neglectum]|uniref:Omega-3 fatty acid desaturase (Delta-15desaturase) n=1 Tax=Monoraphidium neglectum TaxID=145388 RepID=A0A0D2LWS5_9CHLO|nr:omega-3 fatty acid desaturase (delta-15desaturase) [Monoraphidium neglectum]KIY95929.1 omega-3 fatty acid desaturase (delta-15desaturase) [Monoraphidium neglectum]|eukprot:XP_013894949.1 omega-3 fatty acid desaturase (delta-15desaturase) [Monoraphidium neglectum]